VGVLNADGGVGYTIINFASILHQFCIDFEGFAGVLSALFTGFGPLRSRQDATVAPQLSAALFGFF
jgi:hypothetical protein